MTPPRSAFGAPPQGGAAGGPAEPDPRRPLGRGASFVVQMLLWALLALAALQAASDAKAEVAAERRRIATERAALQAEFDAREHQCQQRFAVTDCVDRVRAERREALAALREQELQIDEAERRRRASERLQAIERKRLEEQALPAVAPASAALPSPPPASAALPPRSPPPASAALPPPSLPASAPTPSRPAISPPLAASGAASRPPPVAGAASAAPPRQPGPTPAAAAEAAARASAAARRQREAEEHQRKVQQRLDERAAKGKAAAPLPVPEAPASTAGR